VVGICTPCEWTAVTPAPSLFFSEKLVVSCRQPSLQRAIKPIFPHLVTPKKVGLTMMSFSLYPRRKTPARCVLLREAIPTQQGVGVTRVVRRNASVVSSLSLMIENTILERASLTSWTLFSTRSRRQASLLAHRPLPSADEFNLHLLCLISFAWTTTCILEGNVSSHNSSFSRH